MTDPRTALEEALSFDAKCIAGAWFGMMVVGKGELKFELRNARPTNRAIDALGELVKAGVISVERFNRYGGLVYKPLVDCRWGFDFLRANANKPEAKWPITEPMTGGEDEAERILAACIKAKEAGDGR